MPRPKGSKNRFKKPDFIRGYESFRRKYRFDPLECLFSMASGTRLVDGELVPETVPAELRLRAAIQLVSTRYQGSSIAKYDEATAQQDMFESAADDKLVFGVNSGRAA